jgi:sugar phosphate isomerase/epimerase
MKQNVMNQRRLFIKQIGMSALAISASTLPTRLFATGSGSKQFFDVSLAEFSFATSLFSGQMNHLDFAARAKKEFGIDKVEYVSMFFKEKPSNKDYINEMKKRAADHGVKSNLIMVDGMGNLGDLDSAKRQLAIENHLPWIEAAKELGCYAIRVNLDGEGSDDDVAKAAVEGYGKLAEHGAKNNIVILVENHTGPSVNPDWLAGVMKQVKSKHAGLLVDTANFVRHKVEGQTIEAFKAAKVVATYDKYEGVRKLMPFAKGVSLKTHKIDQSGNDPETDFTKILKTIKQSGFNGTIGVEYEGAFLKNMMQLPGDYLNETEGIKVTRDLLIKIGSEV